MVERAQLHCTWILMISVGGFVGGPLFRGRGPHAQWLLAAVTAAALGMIFNFLFHSNHRLTKKVSPSTNPQMGIERSIFRVSGDEVFERFLLVSSSPRPVPCRSEDWLRACVCLYHPRHPNHHYHQHTGSKHRRCQPLVGGFASSYWVVLLGEVCVLINRTVWRGCSIPCISNVPVQTAIFMRRVWANVFWGSGYYFSHSKNEKTSIC